MKKGSAAGRNAAKFVVFALFLLFVSGEALAATYYVSPTGSDTGSGLVSAPFKTIQKAATIVNPGDTVIVKDGVYTDTNGDGIIVTLTRGGTATNWVTFKAEHKWGAKLDGQNNTTGYGVVFMTGANYVRIEDFEVYGCKAGGLWTNQTASNLYFYRNHIHDIGKWCNPDTGASFGQCGIFQGKNSNHVTYDSNLIHDVGRYWIGENGCTTDAGHDNDHGIYITGAYVDIINNIFYANNSGVDIDVKAQAIEGGGSHFRIINNTFGPTTTDKGRIFLAAKNKDGYRNEDILIQNNAFRSSAKYAVMIWPAREPGSGQRGIVIRNNYTYSETLLYPYLPIYSSNFTVYENIEKGPNQMFADLEKRDFRLTEFSPLINKGVTSDAARIDFHGNRRMAGEECAIGAYEYFNNNDVDMGVNGRLNGGPPAQ